MRSLRTNLDAWVIRLYLLILPCLWWRGMSQAQAQAVAWQVAAIGLVMWASTHPSRLWGSWMAGGVMAGALFSSLFHWPAQGYPMLILVALIGWATVWALIQLSPSSEWIEQSLVWLALVNVGYALSQQCGYDPLFDTPSLTGWMGRPNTLSVLWVAAVPLARGWAKWVLVVAILWLQNWTAMVGLGVLGVGWAWRRWPQAWWRVVAGTGVLLAGAVGWWGLHPGLWTMKVLPRVLTWQETFGQSLWSPVWGYGLGARSAMSKIGWTGDIGYNVWLEAFHAGGLLVLVPCVLIVRQIWRSVASPSRTALLVVASAGCVQSLWNSTGLVIVTLALFAAWELRRLDAV